MAVITVPQLADNYAYLVVDDRSLEAGVVDCAEAGRVLDAVKQHALKLVAVLSTHWHADHVGGNQDLLRAQPQLRVYGARAEGGRIPGLTEPLNDGDPVQIGAVRGRVIGIPAHTSGHIAYYFPELRALFSGDTLFVGGCGRLFEGRAATMVESLAKLAALPDDTRLFCGHEYAETNLRFALTLEPDNGALKRKYEWAMRTRAEGKYTVPSTIGEEKQTNPFLRTASPELRASLKRIDPTLGGDAVAIFARTRELKDRF